MGRCVSWHKKRSGMSGGISSRLLFFFFFGFLESARLLGDMVSWLLGDRAPVLISESTSEVMILVGDTLCPDSDGSWPNISPLCSSGWSFVSPSSSSSCSSYVSVGVRLLERAFLCPLGFAVEAIDAVVVMELSSSRA